jgi:transcription elongation factor S-II
MGISVAEMAKLVSTAVGAAAAAEDGDKAEAARAVDVLKQLAKSHVTADLLRQTEAGKKINKLVKSAVQEVAQAAQAAVQAWKESVKQQHGAAAGGDKPKQQADAKQPSLQRSGSGAAPSPSPAPAPAPAPAAPAGKASLDLSSIKGFPPSYAEPIRKNACKMFAEGLALALAEGDVELADPGMVATLLPMSMCSIRRYELVLTLPPCCHEPPPPRAAARLGPARPSCPP